jgi:hypothetical protein
MPARFFRIPQAGSHPVMPKPLRDFAVLSHFRRASATARAHYPHP